MHTAAPRHDLAELERIASALAVEAGARIRSLRERGVAVAQTKSSLADVVTEADREAEQLLTRRILELRPDDGLLGEEGASVEGSTGITWVVDPIDGTVNYLYGLPFYAVSVAATMASPVPGPSAPSPEPVPRFSEPVEENGILVSTSSTNATSSTRGTGATNASGSRIATGSAAQAGAMADGRTAIAGAVHLPVLGETFSAHEGCGARLNGRAIGVGDESELSLSLVGTGFGYTVERRAEQAEVARRIIPQVRDIRRMGSAAIDLCMVACGRLDAYFERGLNPWDYAAGALIAREAGASILGLNDELLPGERMIVAGPPALARELRARVQAAYAELGV